jgi:hypothetical protein
MKRWTSATAVSVLALCLAGSAGAVTEDQFRLPLNGPVVDELRALGGGSTSANDKLPWSATVTVHGCKAVQR